MAEIGFSSSWSHLERCRAPSTATDRVVEPHGGGGNPLPPGDVTASGVPGRSFLVPRRVESFNSETIGNRWSNRLHRRFVTQGTSASSASSSLVANATCRRYTNTHRAPGTQRPGTRPLMDGPRSRRRPRANEGRSFCSRPGTRPSVAQVTSVGRCKSATTRRTSAIQFRRVRRRTRRPLYGKSRRLTAPLSLMAVRLSGHSGPYSTSFSTWCHDPPSITRASQCHRFRPIFCPVLQLVSNTVPIFNLLPVLRLFLALGSVRVIFHIFNSYGTFSRPCSFNTYRMFITYCMFNTYCRYKFCSFNDNCIFNIYKLQY